MKRLAMVAAIGLALVCWGPCRATADYWHVFTTNAQVTISDGYLFSTRPDYVPPDGVPDTFYPGGRPPGVLNAFYGGPNAWELRGVVEYDVSTLAGIALTSATLCFRDPYDPRGYFPDQNLVSGYFGDGQISLNDYLRTDIPLGFLPGHLNQPPNESVTVTIDVLPFLQAAIDAGQSYVGFVLSQKRTTNGVTFEHGTELVLHSDTDFAVPSPLEPPPFNGAGYNGGEVPEAASLSLIFAGLPPVLFALFRRRRPHSRSGRQQAL